jgi:hypothetical protein
VHSHAALSATGGRAAARVQHHAPQAVLLPQSAFSLESEQQAAVRWASWGAGTNALTGESVTGGAAATTAAGAATGGDIIASAEAQAEVLSRVLLSAAEAAATRGGGTAGLASMALLITNRGDGPLRLRVPWPALRPLTPSTTWVRTVWGGREGP